MRRSVVSCRVPVIFLGQLFGVMDTMKHGLWNDKTDSCVKNAFGDSENDALFDKSENSVSNVINNKCDNSNENCRGFFDQQKLYTLWPFCLTGICEFE